MVIFPVDRCFCYSMSQFPHCGIFFFQAEDGIRGLIVTGVQTCALPISGALLVGMLPGDHVVVMDEDGYYWAAAVIETVAGQGKKVTVVTRFFEILRELPAVSRISALRALDEQGVAARPHTYVDRIEQGAVVLKDCYTGREETIPGAAAVI